MTALKTAYQIASEPKRNEKKRWLREQLAKHALIDERIAEFQAKIDAGQRELNIAADEHQAKARPIQDRLSELEQEIVSLRAAGATVTPDLDKQRRECLQKIEALNGELDLHVAAQREREKRYQREIAELRKTKDPEIHASLLSHPTYTSRALIVERFTHQNATKYALARLQAARGEVEKYEAEIKRLSNPRNYESVASTATMRFSGFAPPEIDTGAIAAYRERLERYSAEQAAAQKWFDAARAAADDCENRIVNES